MEKHNYLFEKLTTEKIYEKSKNILDRDAIDLGGFKHLYGDEIVKKDTEYVIRMEKTFSSEATEEQKEAEKLAVILEAVIHENTELNNWLGENASTIKTSRYDDIKNGVDNIVEFEEGRSASHIALAIDTTFSTDIVKKFERIKKEIDNGELATIKYFASEHLNIKGEKNKIPRVIVGATAKTVKELGELWIEKNNKELEKHPIQFQIIKEMLIQLETFEKYAEKIGQTEIASIFKKDYQTLEIIYKEKQNTQKDNKDYDNMFDVIKDNLKIFQ